MVARGAYQEAVQYDSDGLLAAHDRELARVCQPGSPFGITRTGS
jgi:hypothetical protein